MDTLARRLSLAAARRGLVLQPSRQRVWRWEHRRAEPGPEYRLLLADVFEVPEEAIGTLAWPRWLCADTAHPFTVHGNRSALLEAIVDLQHPDRRDFLTTSGNTLIALAHEWADAPRAAGAGARQGRRVDAALLEWLETRAAELRPLAARSGSECLPLVKSVAETSIKLLDHARDQATERRLYAIAAGTAQQAGWLHFDQGRYTTTRRLWSAALHAAHQADQTELGVGILADLAYLGSWLERPDAAVGILDHARSRSRAPAARSLLEIRRARALAQLGEARAAEGALNRAERELERARPGHAPSWVAWMSPADLAVDSGRCWLDLGDNRRGDEALETGLTLLDPDRGRTRAVALVYGVDAALAGHDLPHAAAAVQTAVNAALDSRATRCISLARNAVDRLTPYRTHPAVREAQDSARTALATTS